MPISLSYPDIRQQPLAKSPIGAAELPPSRCARSLIHLFFAG
jgi:hypothetical protein